MNPMIEKVARAICRGYMTAYFEGDDIERIVEAEWRDWTDEARAAIEAMRPLEFGDLPEEMALAGEGAMDGRTGSYHAAHEVFAAMIDAALADGPDPIRAEAAANQNPNTVTPKE